jgi:hypothetical protein
MTNGVKRSTVGQWEPAQVCTMVTELQLNCTDTRASRHSLQNLVPEDLSFLIHFHITSVQVYNKEKVL